MKQHWGPVDGSDSGSLRFFNTVLSVEKVDSNGTDLWACMDIIRRSLNACILGLLLAEAGCKTIEELEKKVCGRRWLSMNLILTASNGW